jgi:hypothetical protein
MEKEAKQVLTQRAAHRIRNQFIYRTHRLNPAKSDQSRLKNRKISAHSISPDSSIFRVPPSALFRKLLITNSHRARSCPFVVDRGQRDSAPSPICICAYLWPKNRDASSTKQKTPIRKSHEINDGCTPLQPVAVPGPAAVSRIRVHPSPMNLSAICLKIITDNAHPIMIQPIQNEFVKIRAIRVKALVLSVSICVHPSLNQRQKIKNYRTNRSRRAEALAKADSRSESRLPRSPGSFTCPIDGINFTVSPMLRRLPIKFS